MHSFLGLSSLNFAAETVETANPIVKANAKTIVNFFMIGNFYWLILNSCAKLKIFRLITKCVNNYLELFQIADFIFQKNRAYKQLQDLLIPSIPDH